MLEAIERILAAVTPLLVAATTVYGGVLVAKINKVNTKVDKVQKDIITNHGSKNIGDAIDRLWEKLGVVSDNQQDLIENVKKLHAQDDVLEGRMSAIERFFHPRSARTHTGPVAQAPATQKGRKPRIKRKK
ncbi:membrane protein [Microbacterium phage Cheeto1]|nr:membrane protein [Microbacterium phage Cheeto1]